MQVQTCAMDPKINIYVVCHKPSYVPVNPYLRPIQVGAALSNIHMVAMQYDDEGDNISIKNKRYCELTAQYWAWKNEDADYYGFFHYRRYLSFHENELEEDGWGNIVYPRINDRVIREIGLEPNRMREVISQYDIITVKARTLKDGVTIYQEYGKPDFQNRADLDKTLKIISEKYPEYEETASQYMASYAAYECNMFIMKKDEYHKYCSWLFDILESLESQIDFEHYSVEETRVMGFIAERLFGIYYTYRKKAGIRTLELQKTFFKDTEHMAIVKPVLTDGVPVVLAANDKFAPYLSTMIQSIVDNASGQRNYDLIVLHKDITTENQIVMCNQLCGRINMSLRFVHVERYFDEFTLFIDQHLSIETYYRLVIPDIMPEYDKILYLDCDMVTDRDVAELYDFDLGDKVIGAAKDIDIAGQAKKFAEMKSYLTESLGLDSPFDYFQAGVLIISLNRLREITSTRNLMELAHSNSWKCHDQCVLNIACKNQVAYIPQQWNTLMNWIEGDRERMQILKMAPAELFTEYQQARKNPWMIHFAGYQKPWNVPFCDFAAYFWKYARRTAYYESVIMNIVSKQLANIVLNQELYEQPKASGNAKTIMLDGVEDPIYVDGIAVRLIRKANQWFPIGGRKREIIKKVVKIFVH